MNTTSGIIFANLPPSTTPDNVPSQVYLKMDAIPQAMQLPLVVVVSSIIFVA